MLLYKKQNLPKAIYFFDINVDLEPLGCSQDKSSQLQTTEVERKHC